MTLQSGSGAQGTQDTVKAPISPSSSYVVWAALTDELSAALVALNHYVNMWVIEPNPDEALPALRVVREHLQQGAAGAAVRLVHFTATYASDGETTASRDSAHAMAFDHPLVQLARAYGTAFGAVETAAQLLARAPTERPTRAAERITELAVRAAKDLRQAVNLAFGQRGLGTVQHLCDHIATLENQADALYHSAVAMYLSKCGAARPGPRWTRDDAEHIQCLAALEALTDRCEDVAEALLLAQHVL
ncbi:MAG: hypothetical protein IVW57_10495 [Ktedonobacterales bacterium]|nr:hypothetical protein [Ktedonobacterales bacterium]